MPGNTLGQAFRITTFGESHGRALGVVIDGCPPGLELDEAYIQEELDKRRPGKALGETPRKEKDRVHLLSGVFEGRTTGTPIALLIYNEDARSSAYETIKDIFRPGHGDCTYFWKYGLRDWRGGGRSSGRETAARVAAGAVAKRLLETWNIEVHAYTVALGGVKASKRDLSFIYQNRLFCPDPEALSKMEERIKEIRAKGDSIGGVVEIVAQGVPAGLGEPVFDKLDADLAKALMSIGAVKGVEIGAGFAAAELLGSENNDEITPHGFKTNNAGGILAGISNGDEIICRVAVKPIPSISKEQETVDERLNPRKIKIGGRHDASAIPRIVPVCQAMVRLVLADHLLRQLSLSPFTKWTKYPFSEK
ncbi:chorismate synthase [Thermodesulfatator indicus DSM 15286]|uniref:Chorismate synthase n=1 Tax=Thermodesulfatator indicus (strain DSM 15286 / JCM 11887 / CIR29812) TaxID=667014 RepID=F8A8V2_THEID|nr:chorismate synthase [Thermodesulfatator indicus]AEH43999.1 chorismate synthase [Thermodesulfatator indicus DSM 15286]